MGRLVCRGKWISYSRLFHISMPLVNCDSWIKRMITDWDWMITISRVNFRIKIWIESRTVWSRSNNCDLLTAWIYEMGDSSESGSVCRVLSLFTTHPKTTLVYLHEVRPFDIYAFFFKLLYVYYITIYYTIIHFAIDKSLSTRLEGEKSRRKNKNTPCVVLFQRTKKGHVRVENVSSLEGVKTLESIALICFAWFRIWIIYHLPFIKKKTN